jgi:hypothetical protein
MLLHKHSHSECAAASSSIIPAPPSSGDHFPAIFFPPVDGRRGGDPYTLPNAPRLGPDLRKQPLNSLE